MSYAEIDPQIRDWASRHSLTLFLREGEHESRGAYLSSHAGECFLVSISPPSEGQAVVCLTCVEGRRDLDEPVTWSVPISELLAGLNIAIEVAQEWMAPSTRYYPWLSN